MNIDDIDKIINLLMDGEDLDDDVKVRVYTASSELKNKPNRGYEGGISKSGKFKDFHPFGDLKVNKDIYRPEAQKANHEVNNQLNGSHKDLVAVRNGIGLLKENLESMLKIVNELNEDLKNV